MTLDWRFVLRKSLYKYNKWAKCRFPGFGMRPIIQHTVGHCRAKVVETPHFTSYCHVIHCTHYAWVHWRIQAPKFVRKKHSQWFKVLTLNRLADSNLPEHFCLYFCSTAKWDILKATGWWVECMGMSVHIHLWYQPCPHSVTIIVLKLFRLA